jgi:hypothetical protein
MINAAAGSVIALFTAAGVAASAGALAAEGAASTPDAIAVPGGHQVKARFSATGVQIYKCQASTAAPADFAWTFVAPEATLFDREVKVAGKHYAGPTWEANDGSRIVGKVAAKAAAPDGASIPWLLLSATVAQAGDVFGGVAYVQRVNTKAGAAPATGCSSAAANTEARVPYSADYVFYAHE